MGETVLDILHLSDIHFKKQETPGYQTFRRDVQRKLLKTVKDHSGTYRPPDVVAVTGDIAFSGKTEERHSCMSPFPIPIPFLFPGWRKLGGGSGVVPTGRTIGGGDFWQVPMPRGEKKSLPFIIFFMKVDSFPLMYYSLVLR